MYTDSEKGVIESMEKLEKRLKKTYIGTWKHIWRSLLQGIFTALGTIIAFSLLIPIGWYLLQQVEWQPMLDGWLDGFIDKVQDKQTHQLE